MKKNLLIAFITITFFSCDSTSYKQSSLDSNVVRKDTTSNLGPKMDSVTFKEAGTITSGWDYHDDVNKMDDSKINYALVSSTNDLSLSAPYDGYNKAHITVRKKEGTNNVILQIDKGQFMGDVYGATIRVRFDTNKPEQYYCLKSSDNDPAVLFISSANKFISKLKKSNKVLIEAVIYQDGTQQLEFNITGFKWNH